jgi:FMN reductase
MGVLVISGGYGLDGSTGIVAQTIVARTKSKGMDCDVFRNDITTLPLIGSPGCWDSESVSEYRSMAESSEGFILITPEYHGTMSSTMKLQLDWLGKDQVGGKPFALVSMLGGVSNTSSLNHMRHVVRWLGGWCTPEQVAIPGGRTHLSDDDLVEEGLSERLDVVLDSLMHAIEKFGN